MLTWKLGILLAVGCGLMPLRPLTPLGCKDIKPQCVCDKSGCRWQWVCVK